MLYSFLFDFNGDEKFMPFSFKCITSLGSWPSKVDLVSSVSKTNCCPVPCLPEPIQPSSLCAVFSMDFFFWKYHSNSTVFWVDFDTLTRPAFSITALLHFWATESICALRFRYLADFRFSFSLIRHSCYRQEGFFK